MTLPAGPSRAALLQTWDWVKRPLSLLDRGRARHGPTFTLRFVGGRDYVIVSRPADVKEVFGSPPDLFETANLSMVAFLGADSMFVLDGAQHRRHRRLVGPPLKGGALSDYTPAVRELVAREVAGWPRGGTLDLAPRLRDMALGVIVRVIFGVRQPVRGERLCELITTLLEETSPLVVFVPALQRDLGAWSPWGRFLRNRRALEEVLAEEVTRARADLGDGTDVLSRLVRERSDEDEPLSDGEIVSELVTLLSAGHETTAAGLAWALAYLLRTPAALARAVAAARAGDDDALEPAVLESLRLGNVIPLVPRRLARAATLCGIDAPAGTFFAPSPYLTHLDPDVFDKPHEFDPERFARRRPGPADFYPFGGGHRLCIGGHFAVWEMKVILGELLRHVTLSDAAPGPLASARRGITLVPADGPRVLVEAA